jgi:hypothetical protein
MWAKHDPVLRDVIPFGEDPYDAVGSFGVVAGIPIALAALVPPAPPSTAQRMSLVRTQAAVVLIVLITLASDAVAMARHPLAWVGAAARDELIALLAALALAAVGVQLLILAPQQGVRKSGLNRWSHAALDSPYASLCFTRSNSSTAPPPTSLRLSRARSRSSRRCGPC